MGRKKFITWLLVLLFLIPTGIYAAPGISGRSVSNEIYYAPVEIYNGNLNSTNWAANVYRNQIREMVSYKENEGGYDLSFYIGSFDSLDLIQIVKQEYSDDWLKDGQSVGNNRSLGDYNIPENWTLPKNYTVSSDANDKYYASEEVKMESYETGMNSGKITVHIDDLKTPLIVRTWSAKSGKVANQILKIDTESAFSWDDWTDDIEMASVWMGWTTGGEAGTTIADLSTRNGKVTTGTMVFDLGFQNTKIDVSRTDEGKIKVSIPCIEVEGDKHIEKIEIANSRENISSDDTKLKDKHALSDYWANYENVTVEGGNLTLTYDSLEDAALGKMVRVSTSKSISTLEEIESKRKYVYASLYIMPYIKKNVQKSWTDTVSGTTVKYWSNDYDDNSTISEVTENKYYPAGTLASYQAFAKDYRLFTFSILDPDGQIKKSERNVEITIPVPSGWDMDYIMLGRADRNGGVIDAIDARPFADQEKRTLTISSSDGDYLNSTFLIYDGGSAEDLSALENGIYKVHVSIMNASKRLLPSACNEGFALQDAYIEKTDEKIELYMLTGGVHFGDAYGYCSNIFTGDIDSADKVEAEYLAYQTDETGWTQWDTDKTTYSAHGSAKVRMELNNAYTDESIRKNCYMIGFYVPMMDVLNGGNPGSGANKQPAILRVTNVEKVEENPLKSYENSAAMGEIDNLEYYIATETGLSQEKKDTLTAFFTEAKAEVQSWTEAQSSESIEKLIQLLKTAKETDPLKEGIYQIPLDTEKGTATGLTVYANVEGGKMTLSLTKDNGEAFDTVQYKGLFGDWQTAELSDDKKTASYTVSYTEEALPLMLGDSAYTLALDFDSAKLVSADFTALDAALTDAREKLENEDMWTASSFRALQAETEKAEALRKNWTTAQSQVDAEAKTLAQAVEDLKERADLADLKSDIAAALKKANDKQYSESSRKALQELVVAIRSEIRDETEVSKEAAEDYQNQIAAAVEALTPADEDKKDDDSSTSGNSLQSFVKDYKSWYQETDYTTDSWAVFAEALTNAEALAENELSDAECEEAIQALMEARGKLIHLTENEDDMTALSTMLEEMQDEDTVNYVGLTGYPAWTKAIDVADLAVNGKVLLSKGQASLLDYSLKAQYLAMSAEISAEETADYDIEDWESDQEIWENSDEEEEWIDEVDEEDFDEEEEDDEDIASGSDVKRTKKVKNNAYAIALASEEDIELAAESGYEDGTYTVDYDLMQYSDPSKKSMGNNALDHGTDPGTMILKDGQWTLYMNFNSIEAYGKEGSLKSMKRIISTKTSTDGYEVTGVKDADWPSVIADYPTKLGFHVDYCTTYIDVQVNVPIAPEPTQEAKIKIDWSSLAYVNGVTDIDSTLDFKALNQAVTAAEKLKEKNYTTASWAVVEENLTAAAKVKSSSTATQDLVDQRAAAVNAAVEALLKLAEKSDYTKLDEALTDALIAQEGDYSKNAWRELQSLYALADALQTAEDVTPAMIDSVVLDLNAAVGRTGSDDDDADGLKYGTLESLIKLLEGYDSKDYTELSFKQLEKALAYGREILALAVKNQCSQSDIDEAVIILKEAKAKLEKAEDKEEAANFKLLESLISRAKSLLALKSSYTETTVRALQTEYDLAVTLVEDGTADQEKVDAQLLSLKAAINGLQTASSGSNSSTNSSSSSTDSSSSTTKETTSKDGYYKVKVQLWHANKNQASAGADCISSPAYVMIEDGEITMRLVTKKMNKSGITAHLGEGDFYIYSDGDYVPATLVSTENSKWIHEFSLPNDTSTYYKCEVDPHVDVMGDEPVKARLKITWSSKTKITESTWNKLSGDVSDDDDDDSSSSTSTKTTTSTSSTSTTTAATGTTTAAGTTAAATQTAAASNSSRSASTTSSKTGTKTTAASTAKSSKAAEKEKVTTIDGREIPYTGDTTPVHEMAALGLLGIVGTLGLAWPRRKASEKDAA